MNTAIKKEVLEIMNDALKTIYTRRSTRKFLEKPISESDLEAIVKAALCAPSGRGLQTWQFTVVENREKIQKLARAVEEVLGRPGYDMYCPEVLIIPSNRKDSPFGKEDNACALENIFLAAHSLGIGSVWLNQLQGICDDPRIRSILTEFQIPSDHIVYGMAALGYGQIPSDEKKRTGKTVYIR